MQEKQEWDRVKILKDYVSLPVFMEINRVVGENQWMKSIRIFPFRKEKSFPCECVLLFITKKLMQEKQEWERVKILKD